MPKRLFLYLLLLIFPSCQQNTTDLFSSEWTVEELPLNTGRSGEPNLFVTQPGTPYISWIHWVNDSLAQFRFSEFQEGQWTAPRDIASGTDWFVNWADFPSLAVFED